jgi:hypothetical protein
MIAVYLGISVSRRRFGSLRKLLEQQLCLSRRFVLVFLERFLLAFSSLAPL